MPPRATLLLRCRGRFRLVRTARRLHPIFGITFTTISSATWRDTVPPPTAAPLREKESAAWRRVVVVWLKGRRVALRGPQLVS